MDRLKIRNRNLSFRVSEEEYQHFIERCKAEGSRSVSDYARDTLLRVVSETDSFRTRIYQLDESLQELRRELERLRQFVGYVDPAVGRPASC